MRFYEFVTEGLNHPIICVDVQPEYDNTLNKKIIDFVVKQTGPVLFFVNAEDQGLTGDTIQSIKEYWDNAVCPEEERYSYDEEAEEYIENPNCPTINWNRFQVVDKGYGFFRSYIDQGVPESTIIKMIRHLYQHKLHDARDLEYDDYIAIMGSDELIGESFNINWTSVAQLKRFNGAYIVGGGRNQCLREVELLMNAFNIKYRRIDSLVYG